MKLDALLNDATGASPEWSGRAKHQVLAGCLAEVGFPVKVKTVENWFMRKSIPTAWLYRIVEASRAKGIPIDLNQYA